MSDRQQTPDLLSQIVGQQTVEPDNPPPAKTTAKPGRTRMKLSIPADVLNQLETAWFEVQKMAGDKEVSQSLFVTTALQVALDDLAARGKKSALYKRVTR